MGICMNREREPEMVPSKNKSKIDTKSKIDSVDVVKVKLKLARDNIKNFINRKEKDISELDLKIKEQVPQYQATGEKKKLVPLLKAKKDVQTMVDNADTRLKLVKEKLDQVELQQMDMETIQVLDDSNKYIQDIQAELDKKDWRSVLDEAKNKVEVDWGQAEDMEEDQDFKALWKEIGGDKIPAKKSVNVNANVDANTNKNQNANQDREIAMA